MSQALWIDQSLPDKAGKADCVAGQCRQSNQLGKEKTRNKITDNSQVLRGEFLVDMLKRLVNFASYAAKMSQRTTHVSKVKYSSFVAVLQHILKNLRFL